MCVCVSQNIDTYRQKKTAFKRYKGSDLCQAHVSLCAEKCVVFVNGVKEKLNWERES